MKKLGVQRSGQPDDYQTPKEALSLLIPYLNPQWKIWECASGRGDLVKGFEEKGFNVTGTDTLTGRDFLTWELPDFDCIVTNPPYSLKWQFLDRCLKWQFLDRCYQLEKPWALLLPLTTLESPKRQKVFKKHGVEIIIPNKRLYFELPNGEKGSSPWFLTAWFTMWMDLPKVLNFVEYHPDEWQTQQTTL